MSIHLSHLFPQGSKLSPSHLCQGAVPGNVEAFSPQAGCGSSEPWEFQGFGISSSGSLGVFVLPGSSTDISEDWEKDFDLDMTEEEVQLALSKVEMSGEVSQGRQKCSPKASPTPRGDAA